MDKQVYELISWVVVLLTLGVAFCVWPIAMAYASYLVNKADLLDEEARWLEHQRELSETRNANGETIVLIASVDGRTTSNFLPGRRTFLKITLDPSDPDPEQTIDHLLDVHLKQRDVINE